MLGGGAKVSVGFLKELQSVIHCHLYDDHTHTHKEETVSCGLAGSARTDRTLQWLDLASWLERIQFQCN